MQTIGEQLQQARKARGIDLADAAQATAIRRYYLAALEADEFDSLPSPVQMRGFLRNYASFLGMEADPLLEQLRALVAPPEVLEKVPEEGYGPIQPETDAGAAGQRSLVGEPLAPVAPVDAPAETQSVQSTQEAQPAGAIHALANLEDHEATEGASGESTGTVDQAEAGAISHSIFIEIGQQLRQRRELLSLSLDEVERHTHIPRHHLSRLEGGQIEELPAAVQARGMLTAYARFLDLDDEVLLLRYADGLLAQREERHPRPSHRQLGRRSLLPSSVRGFLSTDLIFGGGLILALAIFAVWGAARVLGLRSQASGAPSGESISEVLLATPDVHGTPSPTVTLEAETTDPAFLAQPPSAASETPTAFPTRFSTAPVQLIIAASARTWMRILVDGEIEFEGRTTPGTAYSFEGEEQIELLVADAAVISLIYNREDLGSPGGVGEVVNLIYTVDAVLFPTPTITPSPTITPRPTRTPRPTPTPRISPTPRPTAPIG